MGVLQSLDKRFIGVLQSLDKSPVNLLIGDL